MSSSEDEEWELVPHVSMLAWGWGKCPEMYLSHGTAALKGRYPKLTDALTAVTSFTLLSPPMGMDYFGVFDGFFGAYSAKHVAERLHGAIAMGIHDELVAEAPRFLQFRKGWWTKTVLDAFRVVDDELLARVAADVAAGSPTVVAGGVAAGSPAVVTLVLKDYLVIANRGATCRAVIYRGEEAVQLTSERRPEPHKQTEQQDVQDAGGHVVEYTCNLQDNMGTCRTILVKTYFQKPEVLIVRREPRDKFMILATGGVWDYITPAQACSFIQNRLRTSRITMTWQIALDDTGSPRILANEVAEFALRKGSRGNATVTVILFKNFWDKHRTGTSKK